MGDGGADMGADFIQHDIAPPPGTGDVGGEEQLGEQFEAFDGVAICAPNVCR